MYSIYYKTIRQNKFIQLDHTRQGAWINITNATPLDLKELLVLTGLEEADLHDCLDTFELPRIERHEQALILFVRNPAIGNQNLYTELLTIIVTSKNLITISTAKNEVVQSVFAHQDVVPATTQISKFLLYILLTTTQSFTSEVKKIRSSVLSRKHNLTTFSGSDITSLAESEEIINQYLSVLVPTRNVFETITSGKYLKLFEEDRELLEDLQIGIRQSVDVCTVNLRSITATRDSYQIIFTNRLNNTMKFLASVTIILTLPTMIASFYGMNVPLPGASHPYTYLIILCTILFASFGLGWLFSRKHWF